MSRVAPITAGGNGGSRIIAERACVGPLLACRPDSGKDDADNGDVVVDYHDIRAVVKPGSIRPALIQDGDDEVCKAEHRWSCVVGERKEKDGADGIYGRGSAAGCSVLVSSLVPSDVYI